MAEMTIADQCWIRALKENGLEGGVMAFDPPIAGKVMRRYQELMRSCNHCPYCEGKLDDENHPGGKCKFKELDQE